MSAMHMTCAGLRAAPSRLVVRATGSGLQPWQLTGLQNAAKQGRRNVKVERLCKDLQLPRATVLQFLKDQAPPAEPDGARRQEFSAGPAAERDSDADQGWQERTTVKMPPRQPRQQGGASGGGGGGGIPAWKRRERNKRSLGRQAEKTLEMVYSRTQWPSDDVVASMWDLHRLPKERVVEWFQNRRREERRGGRGQERQQDEGMDWFDGSDE